jgi:hypothetical protein
MNPRSNRDRGFQELLVDMASRFPSDEAARFSFVEVVEESDEEIPRQRASLFRQRWK